MHASWGDHVIFIELIIIIFTNHDLASTDENLVEIGGILWYVCTFNCDGQFYFLKILKCLLRHYYPI
jgi:hypothetical protein